jgi:hypothetical protein
VYAADEQRSVREAHPQSAVVPLLHRTLTGVADEAAHVVLVTDAEGRILWRDGPAGLLAVADGVGLVPGTRWSEDAIGTNAMGTTLAVDAPVQIHSAEHLVVTYHAWTCVAAPVHDPDTGAILGAVDISGPLHTVHPALVQLVSAAAQLAEHQLRDRMAAADECFRARNAAHLSGLAGGAGALVTPSGRVLAGEPRGWWPERVHLTPNTERVRLADGRDALVEPLAEGFLLRAPGPAGARAARPPSALSLRFLGSGPPSAVLDGRVVPLTLRPAEVLTALALHPEGLTGEQLAYLLYGDDGNQTTVRGEVHRLRALLGPELLRTRPYRLAATVDSDFGSVRAALRAGRVPAALARCTGPLLPRSEAPEIRALSEELTAGLRRAVLGSGDSGLLHALAGHPLGEDDLEVHDRLLALLPPGDPRRAAIATRRSRLHADLAAPPP